MGEYRNPTPRQRDSIGRNYNEQRCPTHQVLNSSGMVVARVNWEWRNHDSLPDHSVARPKSRRARNPLAATASVLAAQSRTGSPVDGVSSDRTCARRALFLGSIIAALLVILVVIVSVVVAIKVVIRHAARIREKRHRYVARDC